jgi:hypothetical protein
VVRLLRLDQEILSGRADEPQNACPTRLSKNSFAGNDGGIFPLFVGLIM